MSDTCPVVLIETPLGPTRLNEADFDPKKHVLWSEKPKPVAKPAAKHAAKPSVAETTEKPTEGAE